MDLLILVLVIAVIGFVVYLITTNVPMPPYWATTLQIVALLIIVFYLLTRFAVLPNVMR